MKNFSIEYGFYDCLISSDCKKYTTPTRLCGVLVLNICVIQINSSDVVGELLSNFSYIQCWKMGICQS